MVLQTLNPIRSKVMNKKLSIFTLVLSLLAAAVSLIVVFVNIRNAQYYNRVPNTTLVSIENTTGQILNTNTWEASPVQIQAGKLMIMYFKGRDQKSNYLACSVLEVTRGPGKQVTATVSCDTAASDNLINAGVVMLYNGDVRFEQMGFGKLTPQFYGYVVHVGRER